MAGEVDRGRLPSRASWIGFNEAPARWPGKLASCPVMACVLRGGFNEAPARWPGKLSSSRQSPESGSPCFNEAPARWPGKFVAMGRPYVQRVPASMRPRRGGRGSYLAVLIQWLASPASMRPRRGGRGSFSRRTRARLLRCLGFNEAPARWPGKFRTCGAPWTRSGERFNEAPARWPGKLPAGKSRSERRKTRFNEAPARWPGKLSGPSRPRRPPPGFNEAPARWPGKFRTALNPPTDRNRASMRPRRGGRGSYRHGRAEPAGAVGASMRPRRGGRGSFFPQTASIAARSRLQ